MRRDDQLLRDVAGAAHDIEMFIAGLDAETAYGVKEIQNAVLFSFCVIGEAVSKISEELKLRHPEIPWRDMKDFRNVIAHGYFKLEWPLIWEAATVRLPPVKAAIRDILLTEFPGSKPDSE